MSHHFKTTLAALAALLAASAIQAQGQGQVRDTGGPGAVSERPELDRPSARAYWKADWYNESATEAQRLVKKQGGPWDAGFRRQMLEAAKLERSKWGAMIPGVTGAVSGSNLISPSAASGTTWVNVGPTRADVAKNRGTSLAITDAGRVSAVVIHPTDVNTIYAGFAGGGVWKTTNGGTTWAPLTENLGTLSIGAVALDPNNANTVYVGLGDAFDGTGIGLIKSTDGGTTWSAPVYLGDSTVINSVQVAPLNSAIVMVATNTGLFRSTKSGASFSRVSLPTGQAANPYAWTLGWAGGSAFVVSVEANSAAASGTTDGQIHVSADNGATWTRASGVSSTLGVGRITIGVAPSARATMYAMAAQPNATSSTDLSDIFKSTNGGVSWTALGVRKKRYVKTNTESSTLSTLLGGQGYYNQLVLVDPANANTAYFGGQLLLAKTTNGGTSFSQVSNWLAQFNLPYVHADFHAGAMSGSTLIVGSAAAPFNTGIVTWEGAASADTVFTWANTKAYKSVNYAGSWTAVGTTGLPTTSFNIRGLGVAASDANKLGIVANGGRVYLSSNGGTAWSLAGTLPNNGSSLSKIAFDPVNPANIYVASVAADVTKSHLWKSTDSGATFTAIDGGGFPAGVPVNTIKCDPQTPTTLYAGTHLGVYRSVDSGATWARFGSGMPLVNVEDLYISADSTLVRAATFGRGFWDLTP